MILLRLCLFRHTIARMGSKAEQARLEDLLTRTGLNDRQIGELIGVSQPTAWRLRHGRIAKISRYIDALESHLHVSEADMSDKDLVIDLVGYAERVPAFRQALISLHKVMRESA